MSLNPIHPHPYAIQSQGLQLSYAKHKAINDLDLSIANTGVTALLGSNGAGKTSFIKCALGLESPQAGTLTVLGAQGGNQHIKQHIGVMMQDADLPDLLSAREHLTLVCAYYSNSFSVDELIQQCELEGFADKRYKKLSGGQKRRVQFAVAIAGHPRLVFLDEPTTGLDTQARRTLWNTIRRLRKKGTAVLLTTHYLEEADALADHIIVINQGRLVAQGSTQEIRSLVNGSVIRCQTSISLDRIQELSSVVSVKSSGRYIEIISSDATATSKSLLELDPTLSDLNVNTPSLEEAFEQLINPTQNDTTQALIKKGEQQ